MSALWFLKLIVHTKSFKTNTGSVEGSKRYVFIVVCMPGTDVAEVTHFTPTGNFE